MKRFAAFALFAILGCTTTTQTPAPNAAAAKPQYKNLQVFPKDIPREQLIATMRSFTRALGVRCNHCHVVTATTPKDEFDFASDAKREKQTARTMIRMTREINRAWISRVDAEAATRTEPRVGCWTCHRGKTEPEMPPPPEERPH